MQDSESLIPTYKNITNYVCVSVLPIYLESQSNPDNYAYVWAYHICIENMGAHTIQLLSRTWKITDAIGRVQEITGGGIVGEQPTLKPGEKFEYTSGVSLAYPSGIMIGSYAVQSFQTDQISKKFEVIVPPFSLDSPHEIRSIH